MWNLTGTEQQNSLVQGALNRCDFPFPLLLPSLKAEGKTQVNVDWLDLSARSAQDGEHSHDGGVHVLEARERVLGLFYLPPYTRIVLDTSLVSNEALAHEVFLAEAAHAVDYHYMTNAMRVVFWNAIHPDHQDVTVDAVIAESGDINHGHSWFDGPAGYNSWVGEAWMEGFVRCFSPSVPVTIQLAHPTPPEAVEVVRKALLPVPPLPIYTKQEKDLAAALRRTPRYRMPKYLITAAKLWLDSKEGL